MADRRVEGAIDKLAADFSSLDLTFHEMEGGRPGDLTSYWPGGEGEDVMVCVFKGREICEPFHRQDFFFINCAWRGDYDALSAKYDNLITVREGQCYLGQPYSGYALHASGEDQIVILGVLIKKDAFFRECLPVVYADAGLFRFFVNPQTDKFSDEFIHLSVPRHHAIRSLLESMALEYADVRHDTQQVLKSLLQTLLFEIARLHRLEGASAATQEGPVQRMLAYIDDHSDAVTLAGLAARFGYHPNYVSTLLREKTGRTFSQLVLERRMERAALLVGNTGLPLEQVAALLGYSDHSNFYKAFKAYWGATPREFAAGLMGGGGAWPSTAG